MKLLNIGIFCFHFMLKNINKVNYQAKHETSELMQLNE